MQGLPKLLDSGLRQAAGKLELEHVAKHAEEALRRGKQRRRVLCKDSLDDAERVISCCLAAALLWQLHRGAGTLGFCRGVRRCL